MDEPRTHYQLSFTVRQGLLLFVGLLGALAVAYFFGLLTGLSGRRTEAVPSAAEVASVPPSPSPAEAIAAAAPSPGPEPPAGEALEVPRPVRGVSPPAGARRPGVSASQTTLPAPIPTRVPLATPSPGLELFDDEGGPEPTTPPASGAGSRHPRVEKTPRGEKTPGAERTPRVEKSSSSRPASSSFWVQALSASSEKEARALRQRLESHGYTVTVVPGADSSGKKVFRVRAGPYGTREEADRAAARLKAREKVKPWVVPPGK